MVAQLKESVKWFSIDIIEVKPGLFLAKAKCCLEKIQPRSTRVMEHGPRRALKKLERQMRKTWGVH